MASHRIFINLNKLPTSKKLVVREAFSNYTRSLQKQFLIGLISLGMLTVKQKDVNAVANIGGAGKEQDKDDVFRVSIKNPSICVLFDKLTNNQQKRGFSYAFLYSGIECFFQMQDELRNDPTPERSDAIEKLVFLSGLTEFFEQDIEVEVRISRPAKPMVTEEVSISGKAKVAESTIKPPKPQVPVIAVAEPVQQVASISAEERGVMLLPSEVDLIVAEDGTVEVSKIEAVVTTNPKESSDSAQGYAGSTSTPVSSGKPSAPSKNKEWLKQFKIDAG